MDIEKYQTFFGCIGTVDESAADDEKDVVSKPNDLASMLLFSGRSECTCDEDFVTILAPLSEFSAPSSCSAPYGGFGHIILLAVPVRKAELPLRPPETADRMSVEYIYSLFP